MLRVLHSFDTVQGWTVFFKKVNWEIMTQLNFNISRYDNSGEIVPSKGFEKITEVGVIKYLKSAVENSKFSPPQNALLIQTFVILTQPHTQLWQF